MAPSSEYPYKVVGTATDGSEIRRFTDEKIAGQIDSLIASANLAKDQSTAIIVKYDDAGGSRTLRGALMTRKYTETPSWIPFMKKKKVEWSFGGIVSHNFTTGDTTKEAALVVKL